MRSCLMHAAALFALTWTADYAKVNAADPPYIGDMDVIIDYDAQTNEVVIQIDGWIETDGNNYLFPLINRKSGWVQPAGANSGESGLTFQSQSGDIIPFTRTIRAPATRGTWTIWVQVKYMNWETLDEDYLYTEQYIYVNY